MEASRARDAAEQMGRDVRTAAESHPVGQAAIGRAQGGATRARRFSFSHVEHEDVMKATIHETKIMAGGSFLIVTAMWLCVNVFGVLFPAMQIGFLFVLHTLLPLYDRTIYSREPSMNIYLIRALVCAACFFVGLVTFGIVGVFVASGAPSGPVSFLTAFMAVAALVAGLRCVQNGSMAVYLYQFGD